MRLTIATSALLTLMSVSSVAWAFMSPNTAAIQATAMTRYALPETLNGVVKPEDLTYTKQIVAETASKVKVDVGAVVPPDASEKLGIMQQNFNKMFTGWDVNNMASSTSSALQIEKFGPWYVAVGCLFVAAAQREAGREEARQDLIDKIVKGELDVNEMVTKIKEERAAEERAKAEREAEIKRREEERIAKREAEAQRLLEEQQARADAMAAKRAEQKAAADEKKRLAAEALAKKKAEMEAIRAAREAKLQAAADERRRIADEKKAVIEAKRLEIEAQKLAKQEEIRKKAEERQLAVEMKRMEAEAQKQALAEERAAALELKRVEAEAKKQAVLDAKQKKEDERLAAIEAKRVAAEAKKQAAADAKQKAAKVEVSKQEAKKVIKVVAEKKPAETKARAKPKATPKVTTAKAKSAIKASPLAKVLANERGIDISIIVGTGTGGRVLADDVRNFDLKPAAAAEPEPVEKEVAPAPAAAAAAPNGEVPFYAAKDTNGDDWSKLAPSTLKRKTIQQLSDYLSAKGAPVTDENGKPLKKADLVLEVLEEAWNTALV